jgi:hypothetical protein
MHELRRRRRRELTDQLLSVVLCIVWGGLQRKELSNRMKLEREDFVVNRRIFKSYQECDLFINQYNKVKFPSMLSHIISRAKFLDTLCHLTCSSLCGFHYVTCMPNEDLISVVSY